jgi:hypothetical protein
MALIKEMVVGEDGVQRWHYYQDPPDPDKPIVMTGPVTGSVVLKDGTTYDVTADFVEVDATDQAQELMHKIGLYHEEHGHPSHPSRAASNYDPLVDEFQHVCDDGCGVHARSPEEHVEAFNTRLQNLGHGDLVDTDEHAVVVSRLTTAYRPEG